MPRLSRRVPLVYVLAVAGTLAWSLALLASTRTVAVWLSDWGLAAMALTAACSCAVTAVRSAGRVRTVWLLLAASASTWGSGMIWWAWSECVLRETPFPSLADVGYTAALPLAALALLQVPLGRLSMANRLRFVLDGLIIGTSALLVSWVLVLGPRVADTAQSGLARVLGLAYPVGDVVVITLALLVLLHNRARTEPAAVPLPAIALALVAIALSDTGFAYYSILGTYVSGSLTDIGWFLGYALLAATSWRHKGGGVERDDAVVRPLGTLLPCGAVVLAVGISTVSVLHQGPPDRPVSLMRSALLLALMARQLLTLRENAELTRDLEGRVVRRTAELLASQQRFEALVRHGSDVVTIVDPQGTVHYQSESAARVFGYDPAGVGHDLFERVAEPDRAALRRVLAATAGTGRAVVQEVRVHHADGHLCHAELTVADLLAEPSVRGLVLTMRDVSERKRLEERLVHDASHDALTGLANRALFERQAQAALTRAANDRGLEVAMLFLDLDGFKEVNDTLGHDHGDVLLQCVADRLRHCVRGGDDVARLGGDEFGVLVAGPDVTAAATRLAQRIAESLGKPVRVRGRELHVRASIGIAVGALGTRDAGTLLRDADVAMYRAKSARQGGFVVFDPHMHADVVDRVEIEADLRRAVREDRIEVHYQPIVAVGTGQIVAVEALARWTDPLRGVVGPDRFIPVAEESGLIDELGARVLRRACEQVVRWRADHPSLGLSVNISGRQLARPGLVEDVRAALATAGLAPEALVLEMTESVLMEGSADNVAQLQVLRQLGVLVAIDDFGTGYSSLSYLQRFAVDVLKVDRSFVAELGGDGDDGLVPTILSLSGSMRLRTVAEGVEDARQLSTLHRLGCDYAQGYHVSRPLPPEELGALLVGCEGRVPLTV